MVVSHRFSLLGCRRLLTLVDARLYVEAVPTTLTRRAILDIVRLPATSTLCVYLDGDLMPLPDHVEIQAQTGLLISLRPAVAGRPTVTSIHGILRAAGPGAPQPVLLPTPLGRHLCIVTEQGRTVFSVGDGQDLPSPMAIPFLLGYPPGMRICPSRERTDDVEVFGFPCSAVLAITDSTDDAKPYACFFDARGLLQSWLMLPFGEEGLPLDEVFPLLETFMPPHWQLHLEGADAEAGHFRCYDGHVIRASFVPEDPEDEPDLAEEDHSPDADFSDSPPDSDAGSDSDMSGSIAPASFRSRSPRRPPRLQQDPPGSSTYSRGPNQSTHVKGTFSGKSHTAPFCQHFRWLVYLGLFVPAGSVPQVAKDQPFLCDGGPPSQLGLTYHAAIHTIPTPLRNALHASPAVPAQWSTAPPSDVHLSIGRFIPSLRKLQPNPSARPCSSRPPCLRLWPSFH